MEQGEGKQLNPISRRAFLKRLGAAAAGIALGSAASQMEAVQHTARTVSQLLVPREPIPGNDPDIIPRSELESIYHIQIYDLRNRPDFVELDFRNTAREDPLFKRLKQGNEMRIFLINGPYVSTEFLTPEQKEALKDSPTQLASIGPLLEQSKKQMETWFTSQNETKKHDYSLKKIDLRQKYQAKILSKDLYEVEMQALEYSYSPWENGPTEEDLTSGKFMPVGLSIINGTAVNTAGKHIARHYVFLAVRDTEKTKKFRVGKEEIVVPTIGAATVEDPTLTTPAPDQSYPSKSQLVVDLSHPQYPIRQGLTPGLALRHELGHARGLPHPDNELGLIDAIAQAHEALINHGDDSRYWIRFKVPEGIVITKNTNLNDRDLSVAT